MVTPSPLHIEVRDRCGALLVRPEGKLELASYRQLRDTLLKCVAEEPRGVVVDLAKLEVLSSITLSVFSAVWMRAAEWPGLPLVLAGAREPLLTTLSSSTVPRFVPTYPNLDQALGALHDPPKRRRIGMRLLADPSSVHKARMFVRETCESWGVESALQDAVLVASELVDNAVRHAGSTSWLRLELCDDRLTVAVRDSDPRPPVRHQAGGHGIQVVDSLARVWGMSPTLAGGKVVWAVLATLR